MLDSCRLNSECNEYQPNSGRACFRGRSRVCLAQLMCPRVYTKKKGMFPDFSAASGHVFLLDPPFLLKTLKPRIH